MIGLRPGMNAQNDATRLDEDLTTATSGQYLNDLHPLFSADSFANAIEQVSERFVAPYNDTTAYKAGAIVVDPSSQTLYRALADSTGAALSNTAQWQPTTTLSIWFRALYDTAVLEVVEALLAKQRTYQPGKTLQNNTPLYIGDALRANTIPKAGRFVGFLLELREPHLVATLERIGLQLSAVVPVNLYVFHSQQTEPIAVIPTENTVANRFHYQDVLVDDSPLTLDQKEGFYTIGYYEEDLAQAQALRLINYVFNPGGCSGCNASDSAQRARWSSLVQVTPMATPYSQKGQMDFAREDMTYELDTNYGLNLTLSFRCDATQVLIREAQTVKTALLACLRYRALDTLAASTRNSQQGDQLGILAYNQSRDWEDPQNPRVLYKQAIKALDLDLSGLSGLCFPSQPVRGIRNRVIG